MSERLEDEDWTDAKLRERRRITARDMQRKVHALAIARLRSNELARARLAAKKPPTPIARVVWPLRSKEGREMGLWAVRNADGVSGPYCRAVHGEREC